MKWIQIKNPKWIGGLAEEYTQIKNPKHPHEEDRDWPEVDRRKRSASRQIGGVGLNLTMAATLTMVGPATLRE